MVPALVVEAINDSAAEAIDKLVVLALGLATRVEVGLAGIAAIDVASVDPEAVRRAVERYIDQYDGEKLCSELVDVRDLELGSSDLNLRVFDECR